MAQNKYIVFDFPNFFAKKQNIFLEIIYSTVTEQDRQRVVKTYFERSSMRGVAHWRGEMILPHAKMILYASK